MSCRSFRKFGTRWIGIVICLTVVLGWAQTQQNQTPPDQKQDIPDAPSAVRPPQPFPTNQAPPPQAPESESQPAAQPTQPTPVQPTQPGAYQPPPAYPPGEEPEGTAPPFNVKTVPPGSVKPPSDNPEDTLYKLVVRTNQVVIPVRVTDGSGRMVPGIPPADFAVYEDGKKQKLTYMSEDPLALSAAVILDLGMPDASVQKVNKTFSALEGAFGPYDEVALYTYSSTVSKAADFGAVGKRLDAVLDQLKYVTGSNNGPPEIDGPMGPQGPVINGVPVDPNVPHNMAPAQQSHVLNDAILAAAVALNKREKTRRKIIFVISDGREYRSTASYSDVLKVLLTNNVTVYAIGVGSAALPGYSKLAKIHLPRMGYTDILPKYSNATAGEYLTDNSRDAIESAYARAMGEARNEYTLVYQTRATISEACHDLEVTVARTGVNVYAKQKYCPGSPAR